MRPSNVEIDLESIITPLVMKFKQVEMGIECSAKAYIKLIDIVFWAQRAVLFPIAPLQDPITKELKPDFEKALLRIFRICDKDFDGYLNDWEIGELQTDVFSSDLLPCHIDGLKEFLLQKCESDKYTREDTAKGINFEAFKCLQTIFIKKMKLQTSWLILEHFGYNEKLRINEKHLVNLDIKEAEVSEKWEGIELSDIAIEYLTNIFKKYAKEDLLDHDGLEEIFLTTVEGIPWEVEEIAKVQQNSCIDCNTWIGLWQKAFSDDYTKAFELIVYLGFVELFSSTVEIKIERKAALLSESSKKVFNCFVLGSDCQSRSFVTDIEVNNKSKYLIITEFDSKTLNEDLLQDQRRMNYCDVLWLIYDGTEKSAKFISEVNESLPKEIAKVLINISDSENFVGSVPTEEIANELKTSQYTEVQFWHIDDLDKENLDIVLKNILGSKQALEMITHTAMFPCKGVDNSIVEALREEEASKSQQKYFMMGTFLVATLGALYFGGKPAVDYAKKLFE